MILWLSLGAAPRNGRQNTDHPGSPDGLDEYPGKNHMLIEKAILEGPDKLPQADAEVCKDVFNFIEFYSTGKISDNIEVEFVGKEDAKE